MGREPELGALGRAWRRALRGGPGLVLVRGEAGVGKTRLVAELATAVREDHGVVAESGCYGTSDRLALAPVADWLRAPAVDAAVEGLDPVWRQEVERLVPGEGRSEPPPVDGSRAMADAWRRHRFVEGLAQAILAVGRPLLLVLENVQWGDHATLAFLGDVEEYPRMQRPQRRAGRRAMQRQILLGDVYLTGVSPLRRFLSLPATTSKNAFWIALVIGPALPWPIIRPSSSRIGVTSAAVPVKKASSAM